MKKLIILLVFAICFLFFGCFGNWGNNNNDNPTPQYNPVIIDRTTFENSVKTMTNQNVLTSGKIYIKDNLMFVNDVNKGFHVFNYFNADNPVKIGFIQALGCTDLAIRNNVFYINQATDLLTLSYNPANNSIIILSRNKNVFPQKIAPNGETETVTNNQIIINWIKI